MTSGDETPAAVSAAVDALTAGGAATSDSPDSDTGGGAASSLATEVGSSQQQDLCLRASIVEDYAATDVTELTVSKGQQVEIILDRSRRAADQEDDGRHTGRQWCLVRVLETSGERVEQGSGGIEPSPLPLLQGYVPASTIGLSPKANAAAADTAVSELLRGDGKSVQRKLRKSISKLLPKRKIHSISNSRSVASAESEDAVIDSLEGIVMPIAVRAPPAADDQRREEAADESLSVAPQQQQQQQDNSKSRKLGQRLALQQGRSKSVDHMLHPTSLAPATDQDDPSSLAGGTPAEAGIANGRGERDLALMNQEEVEKCYRLRRCVLQELVETERIYVEDLGLLVHGYMEEMKQMAVLPYSMLDKDKIVFGNVQQIYDFHRDKFMQEITKCLDDPHRLGMLFPNYEKRLLMMYVKYCENKPKSELIVIENGEFFRELQAKLQSKPIGDLLIKPVQRFLKYQLLLKEIYKFSQRCMENCTGLEAAIQVMHVVPKAANDMMNAGRLQGFDGSITAQGKLLHQDKVMVVELGAKSDQKPRERHVFLFEQIIIFSEAVERKSALAQPCYIFKNKLRVNNMSLESCSVKGSGGGQLQGGLLLADKTPGSDLRLILHPADHESRIVWLNHITSMLEQQQNMILALIDPVRHQTTACRNGDSVSSAM